MKIQIILILAFSILSCSQDPCQPISPRLHLGATYTDSTQTEKLVIMFNTNSSCSKSFVTVTDNYGNIRKTYCTSESLTLSQKVKNYTTVIQKCSIEKIAYNEFFSYMVYGANDSFSTSIPYSLEPIRTHLIDPNNMNQSLKIISLADWSDLKEKIGIYVSLNQSLDKMKDENILDLILIDGDVGYDLDTNNCKNYESFLLLLSRIAKFVPVIIVTGNHEYNTPDNFLLFQKSFEHHGLNTDLGVGYNLGPFYLAVFDPFEVYGKKTLSSNKNLRSFEGQTQFKSLKRLRQILQKGKSLNKPIIPISHYPLICSGGAADCTSDTKILKDYFDLMFQKNVALYLGAHYHTYERIYPYCQNGSIQKIQSPYLMSTNQQNCMVSIVQGISGNDDKIVETYKKIQDYSAGITFNQTGFGLITLNSSWLKYQHYSTKDKLHITDSMQIFYTNKSDTKAILIQE